MTKPVGITRADPARDGVDAKEKTLVDVRIRRGSKAAPPRWIQELQFKAHAMMPTNLRSQLDYQNAVAELTALRVYDGDTGRAEALVKAIRHYEAVSRAFWDHGNVFQSRPHSANAAPEWHWFEGQMD